MSRVLKQQVWLCNASWDVFLYLRLRPALRLKGAQCRCCLAPSAVKSAEELIQLSVMKDGGGGGGGPK